MSRDNMTTKFLTVLPTEVGLDFILGNGKKVTFDAGKVTAEIAAQAQRHGFNQKSGTLAPDSVKRTIFPAHSRRWLTWCRVCTTATGTGRAVERGKRWKTLPPPLRK